jgi:hypothetical protein
MLCIPFLAAVGVVGYNQCIDDRERFLERDAPQLAVCEPGLSVEAEWYVAAEPVARAPRRKRKKKQRIPESFALAPPTDIDIEVEPREPEGPYLRVDGEGALGELQIENIRMPVESSYTRSDIEVAEVSADIDIEEVEFEELSAESTWYGDGYHSQDRLLNVMLSQPMHPGRAQMLILHRSTAPFATAPVRDLLGLDAGVKIGLGLRLGLLDGLDIGILRVNGVAEPFDVYEYDLRLQAVRLEGLSAGIRLGLTTFAQTDSIASAWFASIGIERRFLERLLVVVNSTYHANTTSVDKSSDAIDASCNIGGGLELRLSDSVALSGDILHTLVGFRREYPVWSAGVKFYSHRHTFSLVLTNTPYTSADGLLSNSEVAFIDLLVGFNVTREFSLWED